MDEVEEGGGGRGERLGGAGGEGDAIEEGGRRAFIQSEEVRSTHCRVAPTRASPLDL